MTDDWQYEPAKIVANDKRDKALLVLVTVAATLTALALIGAFTYSGTTAAARDAEFKKECMEKGGVVVKFQCYYTEREEG